MSRQRLAAALLALSLAAGTAAPTVAQPLAPVRMCAEWEPVEGVMIRWPLGIPGSLVREMAEEETVFVVILSSQIASATSTFTANGVDMAHVQWVVADSYSHWSRDWGPQCLFDGAGDWGILDPWFAGYPWIPREETGYEQDDNTPAQFAAYLGGEPLWQPPFYLTGGNIMVDGHGRAFCSEAQLSENDHLSEAAFRAALATWTGAGELVVLPNTEGNGIQHIDCLAKFLDEETVIVKQLYASHADAPFVEQNAQILAGLTSCYGNPLRVSRVHCGPFPGAGVAAYTNSLILGKKVLVPLFQCEGDAPALQAYRDAMPGYEVIGFIGSWYYYDALHCRAMGIFDRGMLRVDAAPPPAEIPAAPWPVTAFVDDRSEAGLDLAGCALHWRLAGEPGFQTAALAPIGGDSLRAWLPVLPPAAAVEYYLEAADLSGRIERRPIAAPAALYRTAVSPDLTAVTPLPATPTLAAWPQPFAGTLQLAASSAPGSAPLAVTVFDCAGRRLRELALTGGRGAWDGRDAHGRELPAGVYLLRLAGSAAPPLKALKLR